MNKSGRFLAASLVLFCGIRAYAENAPAVHVAIVVGDPGNKMFERHYAEREARFRSFFEQKAPGAKVTVISSLEGDKKVAGVVPASADSVVKTLQQFAAATRPDDQMVVVLLGHGQADGDDRPTLMLPGPDVTYAALGAAIQSSAAGAQVVLAFTSNSGDGIVALRHDRRVVVSSAAPGQNNAGDFAEFFLQALEKPEGKPSLLDTYNRATLRHAEWTVRQKRSPDPEKAGWVVEGKESADLFRKLYAGSDVPAEYRFIDSPASAAPDAPVTIVGNDDKAYWNSRRMVTDTPMLEDRNQEKGATCLTEKGYRTLTGAKVEDEGFLAARIVLGVPGATATRESKDH